LREHKQSIEFVGLQQLLLEELSETGDSEVRDADAGFNNTVFVVAHDFLNASGAFGCEAKGRHIVDETKFSAGEDNMNAGDAFP
jgi:hypothetical protein